MSGLTTGWGVCGDKGVTKYGGGGGGGWRPPQHLDTLLTASLAAQKNPYTKELG